jgi:lysylphosphatidylglycerol synthetase-like protein (DUF2156 family)
MRFLSQAIVTAYIYTVLYFFTYMIAASSYSVILRMPADQSRSMSWLYYGLLFTMIPYLGSYILTVVRKQQLLHAFLVTQAVDKLGIILLSNWMAQGFPWYGREFPSAGFGLLCEELPFYCSTYVAPYLVMNSIGSTVIFIIVYVVYKQRENKQRSF